MIELDYISRSCINYFIALLKQLLGKHDEFRTAEKALKMYKTNPSSLLQLSRKAVRNCMREGHVLEDCYKLPIPTLMQDYLSLRCLNAKIRKWIIKEEKPSFTDYEQYDVKKEVLKRYQLES